MYIKISNNTLTDWADWEFEGSTFTDIDYNDFCLNQDRFTVKNDEIVDLIDEQSYKNKKAKEEIEDELNKLDELYYQASQAPVEFEGHQYKFEWTTIYQGLLSSGILPAKIWDITGLEENAVIMDEEKLQNLQNCLLAMQESAFQTRKTARSILIYKKNNIEKQMGG